MSKEIIPLTEWEKELMKTLAEPEASAREIWLNTEGAILGIAGMLLFIATVAAVPLTARIFSQEACFPAFVIAVIAWVLWYRWFSINRAAQGKLLIEKEEKQEAQRSSLSRTSFSTYPKSSSVRAKPYDGHVYLIREEHGGYKIGRSVDVPTRFNTLKIQVPQDIELVWKIKCHDHKGQKKDYTENTIQGRIRGEWFALTSEQVREIIQFTDGELG